MLPVLKLKLDENLSDRHARAARDRGCDATTVAGQDLCSTPDAMLLEIAAREERVLITMDKHLAVASARGSVWWGSVTRGRRRVPDVRIAALRKQLDAGIPTFA